MTTPPEFDDQFFKEIKDYVTNKKSDVNFDKLFKTKPTASDINLPGVQKLQVDKQLLPSEVDLSTLITAPFTAADRYKNDIKYEPSDEDIIDTSDSDDFFDTPEIDASEIDNTYEEIDLEKAFYEEDTPQNQVDTMINKPQEMHQSTVDIMHTKTAVPNPLKSKETDSITTDIPTPKPKKNVNETVPKKKKSPKKITKAPKEVAKKDLEKGLKDRESKISKLLKGDKGDSLDQAI